MKSMIIGNYVNLLNSTTRLDPNMDIEGRVSRWNEPPTRTYGSIKYYINCYRQEYRKEWQSRTILPKPFHYHSRWTSKISRKELQIRSNLCILYSERLPEVPAANLPGGTTFRTAIRSKFTFKIVEPKIERSAQWSIFQTSSWRKKKKTLTCHARIKPVDLIVSLTDWLTALPPTRTPRILERVVNAKSISRRRRSL